MMGPEFEGERCDVMARSRSEDVAVAGPVNLFNASRVRKGESDMKNGRFVSSGSPRQGLAPERYWLFLRQVGDWRGSLQAE